MMYRSQMYRSWIKGLVFGSLGLTCSIMADISLAQSQDAEQIFGQAVHQYFSGQYQEVVDELSVALDAGIQDPRLYYYRGLSKLAMGNQEAAEADFEAGAEIEASFGGQRNFNIGRSLMRVQGSTRMMIENARADARVRTLEKLQQQKPVSRRQALALLNQSSSVQEDGGDVAEALSTVRPNLPDLSGVVDPTAPFGDDSADGSFPTPTEPAVENSLDSGFGQPDPMPTEDPFGQPEAEQPESTQPADDPFAAPPADDPFAAEDNMEETAGEEAAADPFDATAGGDDPFAETSSDETADDTADDEAAADPFADPAADAEMESESTDPFAEPAEESTTDEATTDPFSADPFAEQPESNPSAGSTTPENVRGGRVLSSFFGALTAPVRKAAKASAEAVQKLQPGGAPPADFGQPNGDDPFGDAPDPFGDDPFGDDTPAEETSGEDPFK